MSKKDKKTATNHEGSTTFSKEQFLSSRKFDQHQKDVLNALLEADKKYTTQEVISLLEEFLVKEVK